MLSGILASYQATGAIEAADVERMRGLAATPDSWSRSRLPLHFTASALVVHPGTGRVLLRWHAKLGRWLGVGGHGDPGETDPVAVVLREAREETGLPDLRPWPDGALLHAVLCHVPASAAEPAHQHADLRFVLATGNPDAATPEDEHSPLRWVTFAGARAVLGADNLVGTLDRAERLFGPDAFD